MSFQFRKGQLGKIITTFPVMLLIFLIIGIYLFLSGFAFVVKSQSVPSVIEDVGFDNVLLREIDVSMDNKNIKMTIFDALVRYWDDEIEIDSIGDSLENFIKNDAKEGHCLAIAQGEAIKPAGLPGGFALDDFLIKFENGEIYLGHTGSKPYQLNAYETEDKFGEISFSTLRNKNRRIYLQYYYGKCLGGGNE